MAACRPGFMAEDCCQVSIVEAYPAISTLASRLCITPVGSALHMVQQAWSRPELELVKSVTSRTGPSPV